MTNAYYAADHVSPGSTAVNETAAATAAETAAKVYMCQL